MGKKNRIAKCVHISLKNCAILEYLDDSNSDIVNQALEFYFQRKLKLTNDNANQAFDQYMQRHYQLSLFKKTEVTTTTDQSNV